jgi:cobalamin-dependent methionine synthase I
MLLTNWQLQVNVDDVLRGQGAQPEILRSRRPMLVRLAERALSDALPYAQPRVAYRLWDVKAIGHERILLEQNLSLTSPFVIKHLAKSRQVAALICTIGSQIETLSSQAMQDDPPYALAIEGVGAAAAEALGVAACDYFSRQVAEQGWHVTLPLSPGMDGWPTDEGQSQIFQLADGKEAGVELTTSSIMFPCKSVSFVLGLGPDVVAQDETHDYCAYRRKS